MLFFIICEQILFQDYVYKPLTFLIHPYKIATCKTASNEMTDVISLHFTVTKQSTVNCRITFIALICYSVCHGAYVCPTLTAQCEAKTLLLSNIVGYTDTWHKNQYDKCSHSLSLIQILEINDLLFCLSHLMLYDLVFTILNLFVFFIYFLDFLKYLIIFIFSLQSQRLSTSYCETLEP